MNKSKGTKKPPAKIIPTLPESPYNQRALSKSDGMIHEYHDFSRLYDTDGNDVTLPSSDALVEEKDERKETGSKSSTKK